MMMQALKLTHFRIAVAAALFALVLSGCARRPVSTFDVDVHKKIAGELRDTKLYAAAIEEYRKILDAPGVDIKQQAGIDYLIARIYFEDLNGYEQAAAYYVRARALDPEGSFVDEASRNLVASLEKLGRMADAKRQLDNTTDLEPSHDSTDVAVAKIDGQPVWLSEIERRIQQLPPELQKQYTTRQGKIDFARQYVAAELIYRTALREGFGDDPDIRREQADMLKRLMVDKYVTARIMPGIKADSIDVRTYYKAHQNDRYDGKPFDSVKSQVLFDYSQEKMQAALNDYVSRMAAADKVEFLDRNIR